MKFFEDIVIGERRDGGSHTFTAEEIVAFARKYDPQPFHLSEEGAARTHFKHLCASGWHTAAVCMRLMVDANRQDDEARRARGEAIARSGPSPGVRDVRWIKPVYAGDTITFWSEIKDKRETARPDYGLVVTQSFGANQNGDLVYSVQGAVFVEYRNKRATD